MIDFLILILATWRLASLLVVEDGPFDMFLLFRLKAGILYDQNGEPFGTSWFSDGLACLWCVSVWVGLVTGIAYWLWPDVKWVLLPFALSSGAIVVHEITNRG